MCVYEPPNDVEFDWCKTMVTFQLDRIQPVFTYTSLSLDVDMRRFRAVEAHEEKAIRSEWSSNGRHVASNDAFPRSL